MKLGLHIGMWGAAPTDRYIELAQRAGEWLDIFRMIVARKEPLVHDGEIYQLPYRGDDGMGLGKSFKTITHPLRKKIPVFLAALAPKNIQLAVERFDGWQQQDA